MENETNYFMMDAEFIVEDNVKSVSTDSVNKHINRVIIFLCIAITNCELWSMIEYDKTTFFYVLDFILHS